MLSAARTYRVSAVGGIRRWWKAGGNAHIPHRLVVN